MPIRRKHLCLFLGVVMVCLLANIFFSNKNKNKKFSENGYILGYNFRGKGGIKLFSLKTGEIFNLYGSEGTRKKSPVLAAKRNLVFFVDEENKKVFCKNLFVYYSKVIYEMPYLSPFGYNGVLTIDPDENFLIIPEMESWCKFSLKLYQIDSGTIKTINENFFLYPHWTAKTKFVSAIEYKNPYFVEFDIETWSIKKLPLEYPKNSEYVRFSPDLKSFLVIEKNYGEWYNLENNKLTKKIDFAKMPGDCESILFSSPNKIIVSRISGKTFLGYFVFNLETEIFEFISKKEVFFDAQYLSESEARTNLVERISQRKEF